MVFEEIVEKYSEKIYYVVRRIVVSHDDADDVVQNTFIKVWQNFDNFRGEAGIYTWIYRIAVNEALGFLRSKHSSRYIGGEDSERELRNLYSNDPYFDGDAAEKAFCMAIETLPPKQRAVFNMRYFDEMPYNEMAEIMETSEGALKASYHHAQKKVQDQLNLFMQSGI